ncbi:MAG TPA: polysaccharide biosynthesis/export family protein [Pseudolabrys sp.]|nr:polysaccharide biosynthesis/export family protein [Pseudolabrys sp.]
MRKSRILLAAVVALAAASCARQQQTYVIDPATGQAVPVMAQQSYAQAPQASSTGDRGLFGSQSYAPPQVAQPQYAQQSYAQQTYQPQTYQQPAAQPAPPPSERGLFNSRSAAPQVYGQPQAQQPYVLQYTPPRAATPQYAQPQYATPQYATSGGAYASASPYEQPYTLDAGDRLRIVVFGQDGISNAYVVDAGGNVNLPLIGTVPARGATTGQLSQRIAERLKQGFVREPHVTVEVEAYRPFFILGEVTNPGQYPYVADMTVEKAIAIAGGFAPRASHSNVEITRNVPGQQFKGQVPLTYPMRPGDTVVVKERWF